MLGRHLVALWMSLRLLGGTVLQWVEHAVGRQRDFVVRLLIVLVGVGVVFPSMGCASATRYSALAARFPNARLRGVCALPKALEPEVYEWVYTPGGRLVSSANEAEFGKIAPIVRDIFVFDVEASKDSPRILPNPDNALECKTGFSWLEPSPVAEAPPTGCRGICQLPASSLTLAVVHQPCPISAAPQAVGLVDAGRGHPDARWIGQTVPETRSPFLQPLGGVAYAPNCADLVRAAEKANARDKSKEVGRLVGLVLEDRDEGLRRLIAIDPPTIRILLARSPDLVEQMQANIAARLDEIPDPPMYDDPELAGIAQKAFEEGYGIGVDEIQTKWKIFDAKMAALEAVVTGFPGLARSVGRTALELAILRFRRLPMFVPGAAGGAGFFLRLTKAVPKVASAPIVEPPSTLPDVAAKAAEATAKAIAKPTSTGQLHHAISEKVFEALEKMPKLKGNFKLRDAQFAARAATREAHVGYQKWHQALDKEVVRYIEKTPDLDPKTFASWLYKRYMQPDLAKRFPGGLGANK